MERVSGIGGVFFRAADPGALKRWYEEHLGVTMTPTDYAQQSWQQEAGTTVLSCFPATRHDFCWPVIGADDQFSREA